MVLKKGWFSESKMLEICRQASREEYVQEDSPIRAETQNTEKKNPALQTHC